MAQNPVDFEKFSKQAAEQGQEALAAATKSANAWMKGYENWMKTCMQIAQDASERNSSAAKKLMGCKTVQELTEAQNQIAQQSFDEMISDVTRLSELSIKTATESMQPLNDQVTKAVKRATSAAA